MSGGRSTQQQSSTFTDNRTVLGQDSTYAGAGATIAQSSTTNNYVVDGGLVNAASGIATDALGVVGGVVDASTQQTAQALNFGSDALSGALDFGSGTLTKALNFGSDALAFGQSSLDASGRTTAQAFNFGSDALSGALDSAHRFFTGALNAVGDATSGALDSNNRAVTQAFNFGSDALGLADTFYERALDYSTHSTDSALANLQQTQALTAAAYNDAKGRGALTDKLLMLAVGVMGLVAFAAVKGKL